MSCEEFEDSYDLFALGSLQNPEAGLFRDHLATGCATCQEGVKLAVDRARHISATAPLVEPPARLRERIRLSINPELARKPSLWPWALGLAAACLVFAAFVFTQRGAINDQRQLVTALTSENARVSKALEILGAPGTVEVPLADTSQRKLSGILYVHKKLGMAMVINQLPALPKGWVYETWMVPKGGAPRAVESFAADSQGRAVSIVTGPVEIAAISSMAVSMERQGSSPVKPTTIIFTAGV